MRAAAGDSVSENEVRSSKFEVRSENEERTAASSFFVRTSNFEPRAKRVMTVTGFFTDSTLCIGCKACEVSCKEWNDVPHDGFCWTGNSYDTPLALGPATWR